MELFDICMRCGYGWGAVMSVVVIGQRLGSWEMVAGSTAREVVLP